MHRHGDLVADVEDDVRLRRVLHQALVAKLTCFGDRSHDGFALPMLFLSPVDKEDGNETNEAAQWVGLQSDQRELGNGDDHGDDASAGERHELLQGVAETAPDRVLHSVIFRQSHKGSVVKILDDEVLVEQPALQRPFSKNSRLRGLQIGVGEDGQGLGWCGTALIFDGPFLEDAADDADRVVSGLGWEAARSILRDFEVGAAARNEFAAFADSANRTCYAVSFRTGNSLHSFFTFYLLTIFAL
mmetsp:Transcript_19565/g.54371  ORF Transcript_19565/g.54371 Transcript_19565/m.54371 type:complete len:244 (+) Transcript_19565:352-1083(+)